MGSSGLIMDHRSCWTNGLGFSLWCRDSGRKPSYSMGYWWQYVSGSATGTTKYGGSWSRKGLVSHVYLAYSRNPAFDAGLL